MSSARFKLAGLAVSATLIMASAAAAQTAPYVRTAIVSPTPGNAAASGTTLLTTIAGLSPAPSVTNRWLIKIEPGIYDIGTTAMQMAAYVDYEGSGPLVTIIRGNVGPNSASNDDATSSLAVTSLNEGVVRGANNSELRDLTIECVPTSKLPACMGMINDAVSPKVTNVRIQITASSAGGHWGMRNYDAWPTLSGLDVYITGASSADNYGIVNVQTSFSAMNPTLKDSQIVVGGSGTNNWGVLNRGSARMPIAKSQITASGGVYAAALVHNTGSGGGGTGAYLIENSTLWATGGSLSSHGIDASPSADTSIKPMVFSSRVRGDDIAIKTSYSAATTVTNSILYGATYSVESGTAEIASTWIQGGIVAALSATCASVWNNAFTLYATTCP